MVEMVSCRFEWLDRIVSVEDSSRTISIKGLRRHSSHTGGSERYELEPFRSDQTLPSKFSRCLGCRTLLDHYTGWVSPHLLVTHHNNNHTAPLQDSTLHELLACDPQGSFEEGGLQFEVEDDVLPLEEEGGGLAYHLVDGPTVLWKRGACVYFVHGPDLEQVEVNLEKSTSAHIQGVRRMWCVEGGGGGGEGGALSILLMLQLLLKGTDRYREFGERDWLCLQLRLTQRGAQSGAGMVEVSPTPRHPVPPDYGCIATCIAPYERCGVEASSGLLWQGLCLLVGTEYRQVVRVEGGDAKQVISLQAPPQHLLPFKVGDVCVCVN